MNCPYCQHSESKVTDSRDTEVGVRRRRECFECGTRFTTYERIQSAALLVIKRDGRREEFDRSKLLAGIRLACAKRSLPTGSIEKVVDDIEIGLQQLGRAEVSTKLIGEMAVERVKNLDRVAYIRFASIYKDFADIESFREEVEELLSARGNTKGEPQEQLTLIPLDTLQSSQQRRRGRRLGQVSGPRRFAEGA